MSLDNQIIQEFKSIINNKRLAHAYLFEGGNTQQRHEMALFLAKSRFCQNLHDGLPCMQCVACKTIDLNDNPDVLEIDTDKRSIGVDVVKMYKEAMSTSATQGDTKILIINDAQKMTPQAANNLLKFIEEPEGQVLIILLTDSKNQILPTILSRVQTFKINITDNSSLADSLKEKGFSEKNINIIDKTTELKNILEFDDKSFSEFLEIVINWFERIQNQDMSAFVNIQTKIKTLVDNRDKQELFWDIVEKLFSDEISFKYDLNKELILAKDLSESTTIRQLTKQIDLYLETVKKWKSNVAFQACLEALTLSLIKN
ncbi:DNA polymerase III subunit delta' [Companilactobacillus sp. DQM5]|uniref:DNA polymerase III subunit delta' n=1 Tax=Companilactobacillus sp. DQM5 TaxID=3463359 RepID=UPI004059257C